MASLKDMAVSRSALLNFNPLEINIQPGLNARDLTSPDTRVHIDYLKASIYQVGFLPSHPLEIFSVGDEVFVGAGHCRLTAVKELIAEGFEIPTVPCVPEGRGVNDVDRLLRQSTSNSGKALTMLEEGQLVKRALTFGLSIADVARRIGKSQSCVAQLLDFQSAPAEVHQLVREGRVSATFAAETVREHATEATTILKDAVATAAAEGKTKATKKHSVLHEPKGQAALTPRPAPVAAKWSRDEAKLVLNLASTALYENDLEPALQARIDKLVEAMGG